MEPLTAFFYLLCLIGLVATYLYKKEKLLATAKKSFRMMRSMIFSIVSVLLMISLVLALLPPSVIGRYMGGENLLLSTLLAAIFGSITIIPAFVAFPLVGSLLEKGGHIVAATAFLTTLTMVGLATFTIEAKTLGKKFTLLRNGFSLLGALLIALGMGVLR